jgi:glycosyltransferase involved in cell wall biosynthesis
MILKNATSLIPEVPEWINVCNAAEKEGRLAILNKVLFKVWRRLTKRQLYRYSAYRFVRNKNYDMAFSYGEWLSPEFVAKKVKAKKKYIWIHTDIDKAKYVDEKILLGYDSYYDKYIFVSNKSKQSAEMKYTQIRNKAYVIHNMCNDNSIIEMSKEKIDVELPGDKPILLSVANLRPEKNYLRQVEVMKVLKDRGIDLLWLCIGSTANVLLLQQISKLISKYELEKEFILLGVDQNPYKYMAIADAVMVLSDFESWSLVITEAKIIGVPVIATQTSGAIEQIIDGETGVITGFNTIEIADKIQYYLSNTELQNNIRLNLQGFTTNKGVMDEFNDLIGDT